MTFLVKKMNMKNTKYTFSHFAALLVIFLAGFWLSSCEEQVITYEGANFVRFTDSTLSFKESYSKAIKVRVHNGGKVLSESINISYTVERYSARRKRLSHRRYKRHGDYSCWTKLR
jgi:hypothetical protein